MAALLVVLLLVLAGCGGDLVHIRGTTTRVSPPEVVRDLDLELKIFTNLADCRGADIKEADVKWCLPHVDRASGEVRLAYQFRREGEEYPMPAFKEHMQISHQGTLVRDGQNGQAYTVIPHDPYPVRQMYVVLIDGSSSMNEHNRIKKVKQALLLEDVKDAFFPETVKTYVVLLQFTSGAPVPVGGSLKLLQNKDDYTDAVKRLAVLSGYTHLFDAVTYATGPLLNEPDISRILESEDMAVTVVALTDGFNNIARTDQCKDNAPRLSVLLKHLDTARGEAADLRRRPTVFTVGLGQPLRPRFKLPDQRLLEVTPQDLCGAKYRERTIDGDLELRGIDNASLMWIADVGGGTAYVRQDRDGLAEAFRAAAAKRYAWFELRYRTDPFYLRRSFRTGLKLMSYASAEASIVIHPSAWLDAPPGRRMPDGWTEPQSFAHTFTVLMPTLGLLIGLSFMGAAWFNTKRALFGRTRRPPPPRRPAPSPPPPANLPSN